LGGVRTLAEPADVADLVHRLRGVRPDQPRRWGRMTTAQVVCHVGDAFLMADGRQPTRDVSNAFTRTLLKSVSLYAPIPWPRGIRTVAEIDQHKGGGTCPTEFAADLARTIGLLEEFAARGEGNGGLVHPYFGRMTARDWLRWGWLHTDHHLRQLGA
jgi:hypothetical protein